jgi:hypothetical protein
MNRELVDDQALRPTTKDEISLDEAERIAI